MSDIWPAKQSNIKFLIGRAKSYQAISFSDIQKNMGIFRYIVYLGVPFAKDLDQVSWAYTAMTRHGGNNQNK